MTARGVEFLELWIEHNMTSGAKESADAGLLAAKLVAEAALAGFTLTDMKLDEEIVEDYIRDIVAHAAEPRTRDD